MDEFIEQVNIDIKTLSELAETSPSKAECARLKGKIEGLRLAVDRYKLFGCSVRKRL